MATCARPGCSRPSEVALGYDRARRVAWLAVDPDEGALALCGIHAERMAVPRGWALEDRRVEAPELEPDPGLAELRWEPRFDQGDDLDGLLAARTPLLSRAFGGTGGPAPTPRRRRRSGRAPEPPPG